MRRIAGMTPCWNEQTTIAFTVGSLIDYVDYYCVVDSGSDDATVPLLQDIFKDELESGKLEIVLFGKPKDFDISQPKNLAIDLIRKRGCSHFIRLDGDDVFTDEGARFAVSTAKHLDDNITHLSINHWELYQHKAKDTLQWLELVEHDLTHRFSKYPYVFYNMRIPPARHDKRHNGSWGHKRIYRTRGAKSIGGWLAESRGQKGEDICHPADGENKGGGYPTLGHGTREDIVHYGWARPMDKKTYKDVLWHGQAKALKDPRVNKLHTQWDIVPHTNMTKEEYGNSYWPQTLMHPFTAHPKAVSKYIEEVMLFMEEYNG